MIEEKFSVFESCVSLVFASPIPQLSQFYSPVWETLYKTTYLSKDVFIEQNYDPRMMFNA